MHSDGGLGFPHQSVSDPANDYIVTPTDTTATYEFYCHSHGPTIGTTLRVH